MAKKCRRGAGLSGKRHTYQALPNNMTGQIKSWKVLLHILHPEGTRFPLKAWVTLPFGPPLSRPLQQPSIRVLPTRPSSEVAPFQGIYINIHPQSTDCLFYYHSSFYPTSHCPPLPFRLIPLRLPDLHLKRHAHFLFFSPTTTTAFPRLVVPHRNLLTSRLLSGTFSRVAFSRPLSHFPFSSACFLFLRIPPNHPPPTKTPHIPAPTYPNTEE